MEYLPQVLPQKDHDRIICALDDEGLNPYSPVTQQHLLCEYRKAKVPEGRPWGTSKTSDADYLIAYVDAMPAYQKAQ